VLLVPSLGRLAADCIWSFAKDHAIQGRKSKNKRGVAISRYELHKTIVLVGLMGAGKTAVGKCLARQLDVPFLDSDDEIIRAANMSIAEIFTRDGEAFFRDRETQVISRLLAAQPGVLSTGGGAFLSPVNRQLIHQAGVSVWLKADVDLLWQRVRHKSTRPLLRTKDPFQTLKGLLLDRAPLYAQADLTVISEPEFSIEEMSSRVLDVLLSQRPDVVEENKHG